MNKSNTTVTAEHCGMAPMDFFFAAEFELNDEQGSTVYAQTCFWPDGSSFFAVDKVSMYEEKYVNESIVLERYDTLEEASDSEYFLYYLELDKLTDKKVIEVMNYIDDTRNFNSRIGARVEKHGVCPYIEVFNTTQPQYNEYLQIRTSENGYVYSASHKSYYMRLELGDMYNLYFTNNETPLFLFEITSLDDLGKYEYFRSSFEQMIKMMEGNMKDMNKQPEITEISRRIMFSNNEGLACGPFSINAIDAEIVVNDSGKTIYLHGQWVSEGDGDFLFEAAEKSIYDICERINRNEGDFDSNIEEINKIRDIGINDIFPECNIEVRYTSQHAILIEMIKDELRKREISSVLLEEDDDDEA